MVTNLQEKARYKGSYKFSQLKGDYSPEWCPGCGDFGINGALQQAIAELGLPPWEVAFFTGVGCSGKASQAVNTYGIHTLHGRVLPYALGAKLTNPNLVVVAAGGDGDGYGIGAGHFLHAGRRNVDMTYIVFNNEVYGLTKGQAAPTLALGAQPKSLPLPNISQAINPLAVAVSCGYTFIARSYAFDGKHLKETLMKAIEHRGMALVDVFQPCPTYNDLHTKDYYSGVVSFEGVEYPRTYYLEDTGYNGVVENPTDPAEVSQKRQQALQKAYEVEERVPLGVYFQVGLPTYDELLKQNLPPLREHSPVEIPYHDDQMKPTTDLTSALASFVV
ncbi:MAG: thiamine pyrophosphate-dependent enzyme [Candidatus Melainabacteria bacterium]|nr:thiamine pyrophosphate-dependent enzyme [Candidatus Melainabacteria bacterium]